MNNIYDLFTINLQAFAYDPQAQPVNYTGAENLSAEMKTYYDMTLIDVAEGELIHDQFAQKRNIPQGSGKTIEFRKFDSLPKAMTPLVEGVTPDGESLNVSAITATVAQYGSFVTFTDMLELTTIDNVILEATKKLGSQAGRTLDAITRDVLQSGTNVSYCPQIAVDGTETEVTSRADLDETCVLTVDVVLQQVTKLRAQNAPTIDGKYVAIIHPYVAYDIMRDPEWIEAHKYSAASNLFEGEIGEIAGCRFVQSSEAKIYEGGVFGSLFMGADAYGTTEITGGGLETIIKQKGSAGTADPLNQRSTVGWKAIKTAEILVPQYLIRVESKSSRFSNNAVAN